MVSGLANAAEVLNQVRAGTCDLDWIEVMACPHGCVGGGGQPLPNSREQKEKRPKPWPVSMSISPSGNPMRIQL